MSIKEKAIKNFGKGLNCAQSVVSAYSEILGLDKKVARAVSAGFGRGMGRTQRTCGAVTGGIMVIGKNYYDGNDVSGSKDKTYKKTKELIEKFKRKNNSSEFSALLGIDLNSEDGEKLYKEQKMSELKCSEYIKDVCGILKEIL